MSLGQSLRIGKNRMSNLFSEIFENAAIDQELYSKFATVTVEQIICIQNKGMMRIYLSHDKPIRKALVYDLEKELEEAVFGPSGYGVEIHEDYHLSDRYDINYLIDHYYDSMLLEIKNYDRIIYSVMKKAKLSVEDGVIKLVLPDTFAAHDKEEIILRIFEDTFNGRFHMNVETEVDYCESEESVYTIESRNRVLNKVAAFSKEMEKNSALAETASTVGETAAVEEEPFMTLDDVLDNADKKSVKPGKLPEAERGSDGGTRAVPKESTPKTADKPASEHKAEKTEKKEWSGKWEKNRASFGGKKGRKGNDSWYGKSLKAPGAPDDVVMGNDFEGDAIAMENITDAIGDVVVHGMIMAVEDRDTKGGSKIIKYTFTDFTDTVRMKFFQSQELGKELLGILKVGDFVRVKGVAAFDDFDKEIEILRPVGIKKVDDFREKREDFNSLKRVELHAHTKMSDMDGCVSVKDLVSTAVRFGHKAIAITDNGGVQSFPDAAALDGKIKILYGCNAYIVDDTLNAVINEKGQDFDGSFVVFDLETTGVVPGKCKLIEFGAVKVEHGEITDRFSTFVDPHEPLTQEISGLTSITDDMLIGAPNIEEVLPQFLKFCEGCVLVAHNAKFDTNCIRAEAEKQGLPYDFTHTDTIEIARLVMPRLPSYKLHKLAEALDVKLLHHHRAVDDAEMTAGIFIKEIELLAKHHVTTLAQLNELEGLDDEKIADMHASEAVIFAKNEVGRRNLYKLVSLSHLRFIGRNIPKIPKSLLNKYREGLIVGSGGTEGDVFRAMIGGRSRQEIVRLVNFYDYIEIGPAGNGKYLIMNSKEMAVNSYDDIKEVNRQIVEIATECGKMVCAAGDVHYLDPQDALYRSILVCGKEKKGNKTWEQFGHKIEALSSSMYFMTTQEMMDEFAYLGADRAIEVVITNPNKIADMCEKIKPVRPDKCPPVIEDSDKTLRAICYNKAHELYGENLPEIVSERLERELNSIIGNGFAVMYIIAQKLVWKSVEDGYLVGSRGSVGSSFVATMAGITEVNPLKPHYLCKKCKYSEFDSEEVNKYAGRAGVDMPDKVCPVCGENLYKDGFDIPFETFLGFKGDKEPDIDLNFSSEYQSKAHKYTEVIFGAGQTYKAGTVGTVAEKTAFGYTKGFYELQDKVKRPAEIERISKGVEGTKNTTGQHPGGIVVLPVGEAIESFTPTQHPADDRTSPIVTTHFDYHKIDHNLLKLDILGHDDPTMIRRLQDLTGLDPLEIPLDDPEVMSLFKSTDALGIKPEDIWGTKLGSLGIPEFGTDFAMQMLIDTKPQAFSDLVRIAGLSHGTDVWLGNAETLIKEGIATISTCICTRDDIMTYLIGMGLDSEESFKIMEMVRKGKVAKGKAEKWPEWKEDMKAHNVPEWYIKSCEKIQYMFPKAHAAAYVMMGWRVAYYKINYPLAYYTAFFSIRSKAFSYEIMCMGKDHLEENMADIQKRIDDGTASPKDEASMHDMRLVQEMYARGYDFMPIDLYRAKAVDFQIIDGKIMPSFVAIEGLGDTNAVKIEEAAKNGPFVSKDDFKERTKTSQTNIDKMTALHILDGLPDANQISIFDII